MSTHGWTHLVHADSVRHTKGSGNCGRGRSKENAELSTSSTVPARIQARSGPRGDTSFSIRLKRLLDRRNRPPSHTLT